MSDERRLRGREIKVGLVLYGGVSLAIYENGVTRCFYDLVRENGIFAPLLEALDARAQVDVVAGTSAGGINGILLAAALESGADFDIAADIWRSQGDLGALFRPVGARPQEVESLLDGEGYYQSRMIEAYQKICAPQPGYQSPGEMDVFVTGTDIHGYRSVHFDDLGAEIEEKRHRVVFHLKHRPGRKALGLMEPPADKHVDEQATLLAAISRITSCFPAAFPPFRVEQIPEPHRKAVTLALQSLGEDSFHPSNEFIDGGVLDNKPFGPALKAIFYRMPAGVVDRKLFYVEPDPVPFDTNGSREPTKPLAVALGALTRIPSHESISGDLDQLVQHNERIAWLTKLRDDLDAVFDAAGSEGLEAPAQAEAALYASTRVEALARSIVASEDGVPSAEHVDSRPGQRELLGQLRELIAGFDVDTLDPFDVDFQLRRTFDLLYRYYGKLVALDDPASAEATSSRNAVRALGRIVKALKLVRSQLVVLRDRWLREHGEDGSAPDLVAQVRGFLAGDADHWGPMRAGLRQPMAFDAGPDEPVPLLERDLLSECLGKVRERLREGFADSDDATILQALATRTRELVEECDGSGARFDAFRALDAALYPLQFLSGIHELDRVELVRVSPLDAQGELSRLDPHAKVAGDEVAHFSAFLRRDWRANDILWGRIDGIERIVGALLDGSARERVRRTASDSPEIFSAERLQKELPDCPEPVRRALSESWAQLGAASDTGADAAWEALRKAVTRAGQEQAAGEDLGRVLADLRYQELTWGRLQRARFDPEKSEWVRESEPERHARSDASPVALEAEGRREARDDERALLEQASAQAGGDLGRFGTTPGLVFHGMRIGGQQISDEVPHHIVGEYLTKAYLLFWGMLAGSFGQRVSDAMKAGRAPRLLRDPIRFVHWLFTSMRNEASSSAAVAAVVPAFLAAFAVLSLLLSKGTYLVAAGTGLYVYVRFFHRVVPETRQQEIRRIARRATLAALTAGLLAYSVVVAAEKGWQLLVG